MIIFNNSDHSYQNTNNEKFISVTTLIHKFEIEKDWFSIAERYAKKNGNTAAYWLNVWKRNSERACDTGSKYHKKQEDLAKNGYCINNNTFFVPQSYLDRSGEYDNYSFSNNLFSLEDGVYPELLVWNEEYRIAGQIDVCVIKTHNNSRYVYIEDYKTNKEIKTSSNYLDNRGNLRKGDSFKFPLNHLDNCNYNTYCLQLNLYMWIMEQFGFKAGKMKLLHRPQLVENGEFIFDKEGNPVINEFIAKDYDIPYMKEEIVSALKAYKANLI